MGNPSSISSSSTLGSAKPEPFRFFYFDRLAGQPVWDETSGTLLGRIHDFMAQSTTPYPTVCGMELTTPAGRRQVPWSAVRDLTDTAAYLAPGDPGPAPAFDFSIRRDLLRKLAVEVSTTAVVRIWDIHFVYAEGKMVLAHAETGIRGILRTLGLEKPVRVSLGRLLPAALFKERFATFRHLQSLTFRPDGSAAIPKRILEMHPADLARALRQLPARLRRPVFAALTEETAALVLRETENRLQAHLLEFCSKERRDTVLKLMAALRDTPPL